jgi:hypothetical protein
MTTKRQRRRLPTQQGTGTTAIDQGGMSKYRARLSLAYPTKRHRAYPTHQLSNHPPAFRVRFPCFDIDVDGQNACEHNLVDTIKKRCKYSYQVTYSSAPTNTFHRFCSKVLQICLKLSVVQSVPIVSNQTLPAAIPPTMIVDTSRPMRFRAVAGCRRADAASFQPIGRKTHHALQATRDSSTAFLIENDIPIWS